MNATLTRLPSLATLTAAYYAGAHVGTRIILGRITIDSKTAPVLVGGGAVAGAAVLFSRSSRQSAGAETPAGDNALVPMSLALNLLSGGAPSRGLNLAGARVLSSQEMRLPGL